MCKNIMILAALFLIQTLAVYAADEEKIRKQVADLLVESDSWLSNRMQGNYLRVKRNDVRINRRNLVQVPDAVRLQIRQLNKLIKDIDTYYKYMDKVIMRILEDTSYDRLADVPWLKDNNFYYIDFRMRCEKEIQRIKKYIEEFCSRLYDDDQCMLKLDGAYIR